MCGRYGRWSRRQRIEELLGIEPSSLDDFPDLYNITPGFNTWIARAKDGKPTLYSYLWGLVPYWSQDPKKRCEASQRESGNCTRTADVPEVDSRTPVLDSRERLPRVEADHEYRGCVIGNNRAPLSAACQ